MWIFMPTSPVKKLVSGGGGFLGSHLIDRLVKSGEKVICLDNFFTGSKENIEHWIGHPFWAHTSWSYRANQAWCG